MSQWMPPGLGPRSSQGSCTLYSMARVESPHCECPFVVFLAAFAEWILDVLIRPGDIAVERHRDVEFEFRHGSLVAFVMLTRLLTAG